VFSIPCDDVDLHLTDSWGDGWNGNVIALTACAGNTLSGLDASYTLEGGDMGQHDICIPSDALAGGYTISTGGGSYSNEISWTLFDANDVGFAAGAGAGTCGTCADTPECLIPGCTDAIAENYDAAATVDDGSCEYVPGCTDPSADNYDAAATQNDGSCVFSLPCDDVDLHLFDSWGDGWNGNVIALTDCAGNTLPGLDASYTLEDGGFGQHDICIPSDDLADGYTISTGGGSYSNEIAWTLFDANDVGFATGAGAGTCGTCGGDTPCDIP
jgi:hypothetical protein